MSRIPNSAETRELTSATALIVPWDCLGIASITRPPTRGTKVMRTMPQSFRNVFIRWSLVSRSADDDHEDAGQDCRSGEEQRCVLLDSTGLEPAQHATGLR